MIGGLDILRIIIVIIVAVAGVLIGRSATSTNGWFWDSSQVRRSPKQPPSWVFGVVWTVLYIIYALVWITVGGTTWGWVDWVFLLGMILNVAWVYVFFGSPLTASSLSLSRAILVALVLLGLYQAYLVWTTSTGVATFGMLIYVSWLIVAMGLNFTTQLA